MVAAVVLELVVVPEPVEGTTTNKIPHHVAGDFEFIVSCRKGLILQAAEVRIRAVFLVLPV